eukprot:748520-Hanusia_phi.AAC.4
MLGRTSDAQGLLKYHSFLPLFTSPPISILLPPVNYLLLSKSQAPLVLCSSLGCSSYMPFPLPVFLSSKPLMSLNRFAIQVGGSIEQRVRGGDKSASPDRACKNWDGELGENSLKRMVNYLFCTTPLLSTSPALVSPL